MGRRAMTTEEEVGHQSDTATLWRALGRVEGAVSALLEGQREIKMQLASVNRRVDRLLYAIMAVGGAAIAAAFVSRFVGG